ncbi:MAG: hypothetical protein QXT26_05925 [Thermoproteota archaeon]
MRKIPFKRVGDNIVPADEIGEDEVVVMVDKDGYVAMKLEESQNINDIQRRITLIEEKINKRLDKIEEALKKLGASI